MQRRNFIKIINTIFVFAVFLLLTPFAFANVFQDDESVLLRQIEILKNQLSLMTDDYHKPEEMSIYPKSLMISEGSEDANSTVKVTWNIKNTKNGSCQLFSKKFSGILLGNPEKIANKGTKILIPPHIRSIAFTIECTDITTGSKIIRKAEFSLSTLMSYENIVNKYSFNLAKESFNFIPDKTITLTGTGIIFGAPYQVALVAASYQGETDWKSVKKLKNSKKYSTAFGTITNKNFTSTNDMWTLKFKKKLPIGPYRIFVYGSSYVLIGKGVIMSTFDQPNLQY